MAHPLLDTLPHLASRLARMYPDINGGLHPTAALAALCDTLGSAHHPDYRKAHNAHMAKSKP